MDTPNAAAIDKAGWPRGPWHNEPDLEFFTDDATGLPCLIRRHEMAGHLCGYVGVQPGHPWHGIDYASCPETPKCVDSWECNHKPERGLDAHGGITFAGTPSGATAHGDTWWFGFDCAHLFDHSPGWEWTLTDGNNTYRDWAYVKGEVVSLAAQLARVHP